MTELTEDALLRFEQLSRQAMASQAAFVVLGKQDYEASPAGNLDPTELLSLVAELRLWRSTRQGAVDSRTPAVRRAPSARTAEEWRAVTMWLASALRVVRQMSPVTHTDAIDQLIAHALREAGLD